MDTNRYLLDQLIDTFSHWLNVEDPYLIYNLCAMKVAHKICVDPVWLMIIGTSSDGKSEYMKAFTQLNELALESVTPNTFISGMMRRDGKEVPQFAEQLKEKIWYIYDFGIIMSKHSDERGRILSDLRLIYDGRISKVYGTGKHITVECPNSTLIVGSTPAIDSTILEDQILGTRWLIYRTRTPERFTTMTKIDDNEEHLEIMRKSLKSATLHYESNIDIKKIELKEIENQNLQLLANQTTILRTSVELDRNKEVRNIAYPEAPGRLYKQLKIMYRSYRIIGLTEEEALIGIRRLCQGSISPVRLKIIQWLMENQKENPYTTSQVANGCEMGKGHTMGELSSLAALGLVWHNIYDDNPTGSFQKWEHHWKILAGDYRLLTSPEEKVILNNGLSLRKCNVLVGGLWRDG